MRTQKGKSYILIAILAIVWGSSFILMKRGLLVYTPYQVGMIRIFVAVVFMFPFIFKHFGKVDRSKWKYLAASGLLGNGIPSILFPLAETKISSAVAGMINSLTPIFTLIVGLLFFGMRVGRSRIFGLFVGLLGAVLLIAGQTSGVGISGTNSFALLIVLATICYAFSVNILRNNLHDIDPVKTTGFALLFAGVPMGIGLFTTDFVHRTQTMDGSGFSLLCICILAILGTSLSSILFNRLIKLSGALTASSVTYLIPIVAVVWGLWDNEVLGVFHLLGMGGILAGVYLVNRAS